MDPTFLARLDPKSTKKNEVGDPGPAVQILYESDPLETQGQVKPSGSDQNSYLDMNLHSVQTE